jgi:hypothetical protein
MARKYRGIEGFAMARPSANDPTTDALSKRNPLQRQDFGAYIYCEIVNGK